MTRMLVYGLVVMKKTRSKKCLNIFDAFMVFLFKVDGFQSLAGSQVMYRQRVIVKLGDKINIGGIIIRAITQIKQVVLHRYQFSTG